MMIKIEYYSANRIPDEKSEHQFISWQLYNQVRNDVVRFCRLFGEIGPMGEAVITNEIDGPNDWERDASSDPDFFIVDDQYNDCERYVYVEPKSEKISEDWLLGLMGVLKRWPGWGAGIGVDKEAYILIFAEKIMITGLMLEKCKSIDEIVKICQIDIPNKENKKAESIKNRYFQVKTALPDLLVNVEVDQKTAYLIQWFDTWSDGTKGISAWILHKNAHDEFKLDEFDYCPEVQRRSLYYVIPPGMMLKYEENFHLRKARGRIYLLAELELIDEEINPISTADKVIIKFNENDSITLELTLEMKWKGNWMS